MLSEQLKRRLGNEITESILQFALAAGTGGALFAFAELTPKQLESVLSGTVV